MNESPREIAVGDPLSAVTRKERRNLLSLAGIGLFVAKAGLIPTKITALGIDFTEANQVLIKRGLSLVVAYFLSAFSIYAWSDFLAWRYRYVGVMRKVIDENINKEIERSNTTFLGITKEAQLRRELGKKYLKHGESLFVLASPTSVIRALFEFLLPILIGFYAFSSLAN